jgi:hypothetical protein
MKRIFLSAILALAIFAFSVGVGSAQTPDEAGIGPLLAGTTNCPALASKEVFFVTYARDDTTTGTATVISVTNFSTRDVTVICQFFFGLNSPAVQAGSDAALILGPGVTAECGTRATDPFGIISINANAATGDFEGKGRICSSSTSIGATARLSSTTAGMHDINLVKKSTNLIQKGD